MPNQYENLTGVFVFLLVGMLLRMFVNFYDEEIIDEETFSTWKQEVNDEYPGKGKALFQVRIASL